MKKTVLKSSLLAALAALSFSFSSLKQGSLTDITKPYLGEYECKSATLGDTEYIDDFSYIRLELDADGTFTLFYCPKEGKKRSETGKYVYDKEKKTLGLSLGENGEFRREFPLKDGAFQITLPLGGKILCLRFEQK